MKKDIDKIKEKLKKELNAELYEEASNMFNRLYNQLCDSNNALERERDWHEKLAEKKNKETQNKLEAEEDRDKWKNYYIEVCKKQAKLEIELDITKAKVELLEGDEQ